MTAFCSLVTFRYNMTGYVESLPAIPPPDSRFFSSCTKFQGRDGQVGRNFQNLLMAYAIQWSMDIQYYNKKPNTSFSTDKIIQVIFVAGGSSDSNPDSTSTSNAVFVLGSNNRTWNHSWTQLSKGLPHRIAHSKMAVIGDRIWVVSGRDNNKKFSREVFGLFLS